MESRYEIRRSRYFNIYAFLTGTLGLLLFFFGEKIQVYPKSLGGFTLMLPAGLIGVSTGIYLLNFLRTGNIFGITKITSEHVLRAEILQLKSELKHSIGLSKENEKLYSDVEEIKEELKGRAYLIAEFSEEERNNIAEKLKEEIVQNTSESIFIELEKKFSTDARKNKYISDLRDHCERVRYRLKGEIESLGRRGNLSLVIGVITTSLAVLVLATTVLSTTQNVGTDSLISYYAPRITLSIFIEIFSFFFLRLYKSGLSEIKYFQNELTNLELKFIAIEKAAIFSSDETVSKVIMELITTERNFKLGKDESTVDLEKYKSEKESDKKLLDSVLSLLATKK